MFVVLKQKHQPLASRVRTPVIRYIGAAGLATSAFGNHVGYRRGLLRQTRSHASRFTKIFDGRSLQPKSLGRLNVVALGAWAAFGIESLRRQTDAELNLSRPDFQVGLIVLPRVNQATETNRQMSMMK